MRVLALCVVLALPSLAHAQNDALRRGLINRAAAARDRGDHAQALTLAQEAAARRMSPSLRAFIAQEELALGRVAAALTDARVCVDELRAGASVTDPAAVMAECRSLVAQLSPRVGRVQVRVRDASVTAVQVDGRALPSLEAVVDVEPDAPVVVVARAPGRPDQRRELRVPRGATREVIFEASESASAPVAAATTPMNPVPIVADEAPTRGAGAGPWVVMGLGVASFAAAGIFFAFRESAIAERDGLCRGASETCDLGSPMDYALAQSAQDRARTFNTLTNVAFGVGGAAITGGLLWFILARTGRSVPTRTALMLSPTPDGAAMGLRGAF